MDCLEGIFKIGLTGGIGAGKSTISEMIKRKKYTGNRCGQNKQKGIKLIS